VWPLIASDAAAASGEPKLEDWKMRARISRAIGHQTMGRGITI